MKELYSTSMTKQTNPFHTKQHTPINFKQNYSTTSKAQTKIFVPKLKGMVQGSFNVGSSR